MEQEKKKFMQNSENLTQEEPSESELKKIKTSITDLIQAAPISNIEWVHYSKLNANSWNPNVVFSKELQLLEFSLLSTNWIQPVIVSKDFIIIDGYHRFYLSKTSLKIQEIYKGFIPCTIINLEKHQAMLLTIRINRAKGSHVAVRMSDIVKSLVNDYGINVKEIAKEIGATKAEVELLLMDNVFKKYDIENHEYSKAWYPTKD